MSLAVAFQPPASSALAGSTMPGSRGFHGGLPAPVLSPCFPGFFTDSTSSQNSFCFAPLASTTTPCFPADTTFPERPPQATVGRPAELLQGEAPQRGVTNLRFPHPPSKFVR